MRHLRAWGKKEAMKPAELQLLTSLEDRHWWYRERRAILARELRKLPAAGQALDIGAAGGGNTRVSAGARLACPGAGVLRLGR